MNGIELSERYYIEFGKSVFEDQFPDVLPFLCFGIAGPGSECYGFDDSFSYDHDFGPDFCIFYPEDKLSSRQVFALERAYSKLPSEYMGFSRPKFDPYGGFKRRGVIGVNEFYSRYIPEGSVPKDVASWTEISEERLCEAVNGKVFADNYGLFSSVRDSLLSMPDDIKKKRLSGLLFALSQDGWYNVPRMYKRGEKGAVGLYLAEFAREAARCVYILSGRYVPYVKWIFKGLREIGGEAAVIGEKIEELLDHSLNDAIGSDTGANGSSYTPYDETMSEITGRILTLCAEKYGLKVNRSLNIKDGDEWLRLLQNTAFSLNDLVSDNYLRSSEIMLLV
jgi:hypothetical protein